MDWVQIKQIIQFPGKSTKQANPFLYSNYCPCLDKKVLLWSVLVCVWLQRVQMDKDKDYVSLRQRHDCLPLWIWDDLAELQSVMIYTWTVIQFKQLHALTNCLICKGLNHLKADMCWIII